MAGNPNVLLPDPTHAGERRMCLLCHRTMCVKDDRIICPSCGNWESVEASKPEAKLVDNHVESFLVQPGSKVYDDSDLPKGVKIVNEVDLNPQAAERKRRPSGEWDYQIMR